MATNRKKKSSPSAAEPRKRRSEEKKLSDAVTGGGEPFNIVGIGASAGGLVALQAFFESLPEKTGIAFVVVVHLHPEHESHLADLLQSRTSMLVSQVVGRTSIEPDHVYVIPPNRKIVVTDSHLDVAEFSEPHGQRTPIDDFFRSLAREHANAGAIILSGSGTDGAVGIKDVKEAGGLLLVQDPYEAEYDSMPAAAIATGIIDAVLPVRELARKLLEFVRHRPQIPPTVEELNERERENVKRILGQVHARTGHDFSKYKLSTVLRRIQRRMQLTGITTLEAYLDYLRRDTSEASLMFNDILIGVTNFFRDQGPWEAMAKTVIPLLFQNKQPGQPIRIWSIGCATGEEAYSIGILALEHMATMENHQDVLVIASDLDDVGLTRAREGMYPAAIEADVSRHRLANYFVRHGHHYQVKRELRDLVLFANHSVMRDPPFSHIDLVVCRNVLIYLQKELQETLFDIFHYALLPGGFLFLGSSESAEGAADYFQAFDKNNRIYVAKQVRDDQRRIPILPVNQRQIPRRERFHFPPRMHFPRTFEKQGAREKHEKALETYGPASLLVGEDYAIHHVSESAGRYLVQPKGVITTELLRLVRPELQIELRAALFQAFEKDKAVMTLPIPVRFNGDPHNVVVSVRPRPRHKDGSEREALVVFIEDEFSHPLKTLVDPAASDQRNEAIISQLEMELARMREQLQTTTEEYDSSNEEMKAANEELQSINEEYRSATEELETSKEELQSVNEELQAVNYELKGKFDEVSRAHSDLENLMSASDVATLFLDRDLRIVRYTPSMQSLFNLMPTDKGRSITHLTHNLVYDQLENDANAVLKDLSLVEREIQGNDGVWYLARLRAYRTVEHKIDGIIITFTDISKLKTAQHRALEMSESLEQRVEERTRQLSEVGKKIREGRDMFFALFNANPIPTVLLRREDARFMNVNPAFLNLFRIEREQVVGNFPTDLGFSLPSLNSEQTLALAARLERQGSIVDFETELRRGREEEMTVVAHFQRVRVDNTDSVLIAFTDITVRKRFEQRLKDVLDATPDPMVVIDEDGRVVMVNPQSEKTFGYPRGDLVGRPVQTLFSDRYTRNHPMHRREFFRIGERAEDRRLSLVAARRDGTEFPADVSLSPLRTGEVKLVIAAIRDVSERVKAEQQIRGLALNLTTAEQQERHRISQVLHDDLQQRLFAIKTHLTFLDGGIKKGDGKELQGEFNEMSRQIDEAISVTRNLSADMSPVILQGEGLPDALLWLGQQMHERYGLHVNVREENVVMPLEKSLRVILFQAVREVLFNVVKHAGIPEAQVSLVQKDGLLRVSIEDRGKGFDVRQVTSGSTLFGLKRRLSLLGCQMEVASQPGQGTTIHIDVRAESAEAAS